MNWIDMSDKDKLFTYAKEFTPDKFYIFCNNENAGSYFCECDDSIYEPAIMEYDVERFDVLKKCLREMWDKARFKNPELLATMVSAMTLKNMPTNTKQKIKTKSDDLCNSVKPEFYENVNAGVAPPSFEYEF